ncbi:2-hydroxy-3-oxopropionate reductase [Paenibacillus sp. FSL H8-0034]|uniref:2-hydroxy-3-oxopropionate reductase n=1 Tax=Paenibacillus sp. FSL H8-0034 TaxID=2954671 RepID=UPI0030F5C250
MNIGFIGLGIMGKPMATNLLKAGYPLYVYNRSSQAVDELKALGATSKSSPREVAEASDMIITMLPDSPQVEQVIFGDNGVIAGISSGKIVVDMSSINPIAVKQMAAKLDAVGVSMLDAPVSGGQLGAIEGKLAIMVGGPQIMFDQVKPVLEKMGTTVTRVGDIGAGNTVKLINQIMVAINIAGVSEALAFGKKAGIDPAIAYEAIRGGLAGSRVLETKIENISKESFKPGFRVQLHEKDLNNAIAVEKEIGANLSFTHHILDMFKKLDQLGLGTEDHSALYRWYSRL